MTYHHLTFSERQRIERLLTIGLSQAEIARRLSVHRSTIKKELDRNKVEGQYNAAAAERMSRRRKKERGHYKRQRNFRYQKSFWLVRRTIAYALPEFRILHPFGTDPRERENRKQKDYRQKRPYRLNHAPKREYLLDRANRLRRRDRDHWQEGIFRRKRTLKDFLNYNRAIWREWGTMESRFTLKYRRKGTRLYMGWRRRGRYSKSLRCSCPERKLYTPYRFTRFDWLFRPPNPAGKSLHSSSKKVSQPHPSNTQSHLKRKYIPKVKASSIKTLHSRPSLRKPAGNLCPMTGKKLPPPALKRKTGAKKRPHD